MKKRIRRNDRITGEHEGTNRQARVAFATECKLTCLGGSENGTCACTSPPYCMMQDHIGFAEARAEAIERMARYVLKHNRTIKE